MVSSISNNEYFSLICVQYGIPTLLFLAINLACLDQFRYRMWRLQIWLHRTTERFRPPPIGPPKASVWGGLAIDAAGFDSGNHYHDASQDLPLVRLGVAPLLAFGVVMLMLVPFLLLLAWGLILWLAVDARLAGIGIVLMGACLVSLYYAVQVWRSGGWRMSTHIRLLFLVSIACYFLLAFVLSFLADGVSFFGQSVHFLTLNYILLIELMAQKEKQSQIPAATLLKADEFVSGGDSGGPVGSGERLTKDQKKAMQREAEKKFFAKFKAENDIVDAVAQAGTAKGAGEFEAPDSDEELPGDDEAEEKRLATESKGATLINIQTTGRVEAQFNDVLHSLIHESHEAQASAEVRYQMKIYALSIGVLLGYSFAIYKGNAPANPADAEGGYAQYLGFLVSGILLVWDALMYAYVANSTRAVDATTKMLVLAGSRVALVAFGFQGWFLGVVCLYAAAGCYLSYRIVDRRLPYAAFHVELHAKPCQRFKEFASSLTNPDDAAAQASASDNALLRTMSRSKSGLGIAEFVLIILSVLYFMAFCVSYQSNSPPQTIAGATAPWQQWEIGLIVFCAVLLWILSVWTLRYWLTSSWRISWQAMVLTSITEALFVAAGWTLYYRTDSVILLVCFICVPLFVLALLGTYSHCVAMDWRLLTPSFMRNPPNSPFALAILRCGLQRDDYRMLLNLVLTVSMMCVIGLGITIGLNGSPIGWSITFILFILVTSLTPLIRYLKTLQVDTVDAVLLFLWFVAHMAFFGLLYNVTSNLTDRESFALWGSCVGYPTVLANILCYHIFRENGSRMTKNIAMIAMLTFVLVVTCIIIIFFTLGADVGGVVLGSMFVIIAMGAVGVRWVAGNYTLPRWLRVISGMAFVSLLLAGVALGIAIPDEGEAFWLFSGAWFLLIAFVAVLAYGNKQRLSGGDAAAAEATFRYSPDLFPVYHFDRRNATNPVRPANLHMALYCLAFGGVFVWCAACMVTSRVNIGLGISALGLVAFYTFVRNRSLSSNRMLMRTLPYINEDAIRKARLEARDMQLSGCAMLFDDPQPNIFGLKRWGQITHNMLLVNLDPLPTLKKKQTALKRKLGLGRSCFCARLRTDAFELDDHFVLLERLNEWGFSVSSIAFKLEAHFYFLLLLNARAAIQAEEAAMKAFCVWLRKEKLHPATGQPVHLDPHISNQDLYDGPARASQAYLLQLQAWKLEYSASLRAAADSNEANRLKEAAAETVRAQRMEKKEAAMAERARQREEAAAAAAALVVDVHGTPVVGAPPPPAAVVASDPVTAEFLAAVAAYKATGVKYVDEDFPASPESLFLSGERVAPAPSALHAMRMDDDWKRPNEILALLAAENPNEVVSTQPKLFVDGFSLSDIVQGNLGTCYFLSAIGCLGIRELANPRQKLLTDMFTMESPDAVYNESGAFLVRFYRSGQVARVLIDDRLPVTQGNFNLSHGKSKDELWISLLEKAYAKLFTCYEAIEAGLISQALCDLSNGASETIALKGPDGQVCINPDQLWIQIEDSFKSGYLLGAGSNTGSDTTTVQGIAQGHAYMVVQIFTDAAQTEKLIQLQNPHGHGEWEGDWSDNSDKWTQWWRNMLPADAEADDGKFWMSFQDFLQSYQNLYVCRLLPVRKSLVSSWHGHTACGPTKPYHSPTFCVSSPKACKIWVELEQTNRRGRPAGSKHVKDMSEAELAELQNAPSNPNDYAFIQFYVFDNGGKRVQKIVKEEVKFCANKFKLLNIRQVSAEVFLDAPDTPFTIVCVNKVPGNETGLTLSIFCSDDSVQFWMLPEEPPTV